ncbi:hypothetical protein [Segetibacter aerophilus]|uniref:Uncharacterized protein n=1 Tax=Segetibacter aerophilus TaxID=670293 RepID=A0A512BJF8_9BACT|nr:hypothetical protein [Segetibacter aerophilus]GEO12090.1 hypothetical protein SAE01_45860 [Segetibacter aerophilus]
MTLLLYNYLTENEKQLLLWTEGGFIKERTLIDIKVHLYQLYSFYVEVWYKGGKNEIDKLWSFSSTDLLEPYLVDIDIQGLTSGN